MGRSRSSQREILRVKTIAMTSCPVDNCHCYEIMEGSQGKKAVKWHRLPFTEFLKYEISRPMFRPFLYGAGITFVICGFLPTWGATDEQKHASKYWNATHNIAEK
ncbi:unnamed protein product [Albugo candida]|uniref:Uncharacterized protein n=2 Tax=Albugo candida TaxID=65357 RepID=A0A024GUK0_9STRA|nr:unnamed protein product [Albugo candida]|eukprot:CCI50287.1 unnamed protein product [Albugo candida]